MRVFFSVGEPSGDVHGANLVRELKRHDASIECLGFGGPRMAEAGCRLEADLTELAIMGFRRVAEHIGQFWQYLQQADRIFRTHRPDVVVLIDYPGFNWWVADRARRQGIPVVYYGAPQMWAWAPWRIRKMRRLVNRVLCMLPFEETWYRSRGCEATYVGHPFFDETHDRRLDESFLAAQASDLPLVTLLPGSRLQEITANLPIFLQVVRHLRDQDVRARFAIAAFNDRHAEVARELLAGTDLPVDVHVGRTPELIRMADCCLACSGSVSLELLSEQKPTVIHYRVGRWMLQLQAWVRRVKYITLVNLLATADITTSYPARLYDPDAAGAEPVPFPEYLTSDDRSADMAAQLRRWLEDPAASHQCRQWLGELRARYGAPGATARAAQAIRQLAAHQRSSARAA
ncbi:MAG: lipid-A-disaccharide synthase [Pirellulales bacterium]